MSRLTPPLGWPGGKSGRARRLAALLPPHTHYVEPYAGGLAVLLARDPEGVSEVVNDLDGDLTNFWRVLQSADTFRDFRRVVEAVPFSEAEFAAARRAAVFGTEADRAVNFFIRCRQSLAGRGAGFARLSRTRTRRGMNAQAAAWVTAVDGLGAVHRRLRRVVVLNRPALDVIRTQDGPATVFYLDPPSPRGTRAPTGEHGAREMPAAAHADLLAALAGIKGKFLLSGYPSELYARSAAANGWAARALAPPAGAAGGAARRPATECVWANYPLPATPE